MLRMALHEKWKRGRHKSRFMDAVIYDMAVVKVAEEDADDRTKWRREICCGDP